MKFNFKLIKNIIFVICGGIIIGVYYLNSNKNDNVEITNIVENTNISEESNNELIKIHIYGEVNNPGLIEIEKESRILDAIELAGGETENADESKVNLAYILSDGEKIYIPSIYDEDDVVDELNSKSTKININLASKDELITINGIGEATAESIIEYRNKEGKFENIEDIKNVSGIGDSKFEKIKDKICVK